MEETKVIQSGSKANDWPPTIDPPSANDWPPPQLIEHRHVNGKYRICFEKAASANKIDGFKCEVNGDDFDEVKRHADELYIWSLNKVEANKPVQPAGK